jgi:4-aminobutyrate--pyruvate transaminase
MVTAAKALSSGYLPIAAVMVNEKIYRPIAEQSDSIGVLGHGFTYSGHPVPAAVALETLAIYDEIALIDRVRAAAPAMQDGIGRFADHPMAGEIAGIGMLSVVELVADKETRTPFPPEQKVGPYLLSRALAHGLIVRALGDRIGFSPPLIMRPDQIGDMYDRFAAALEETHAWVRGQA